MNKELIFDLILQNYWNENKDFEEIFEELKKEFIEFIEEQL